MECFAATPLDPLLQSFVEKHIASGVVALVANKDGVLALEKAGYASLANKPPIREDAAFWIASMSKSLTGTALMMLVDEGKVSLDDPVEKYIAEFKGQMVAGTGGTETPRPPKHPITVREIMDHTSGLVLASEKTLKRTQMLKDDVAEYAAHPLRQEPGTKYEYNNCGINTGGRIIEVVSGLAYADFMQQRLLDPLGMKDTTCWPNEEQAARLAHTARFTEDKTEASRRRLLRHTGASSHDRNHYDSSYPHYAGRICRQSRERPGKAHNARQARATRPRAHPGGCLVRPASAPAHRYLPA